MKAIVIIDMKQLCLCISMTRLGTVVLLVPFPGSRGTFNGVLRPSINVPRGRLWQSLVYLDTASLRAPEGCLRMVSDQLNLPHVIADVHYRVQRQKNAHQHLLLSGPRIARRYESKIPPVVP